ncbi:MAG: hypothetical protein HKN70_09640, partial [Gammaproteobacteria bacterium]|nr:hypothetical protein [Gammaproteobacteria bacterium]
MAYRRPPLSGRGSGVRTRSGRSRFGRGISLRFIPIILFGVYLAYYWFANQENVPITGRSQLIDISREQEEALGLQSYQDILSRSAVLTDGEVVDQVRSIGRK